MKVKTDLSLGECQSIRQREVYRACEMVFHTSILGESWKIKTRFSH
jgi:hypothetical protein